MSLIAVVSMVRNEADVIESFVRHNLGWADRIYVAVHESTDETLSILQSLQQDGLPLFLSEVRGAAQVQSEVVTALMYQAIAEGASFLGRLNYTFFVCHHSRIPAILSKYFALVVWQRPSFILKSNSILSCS